MPVNKSLIISYAMLIAWMTVIFMLSHEPADVSSTRSDVISAAITSLSGGQLDDVSTYVVRKSAHAVMYLVLGVLAYRVMRGHGLGDRRAVGFSILLCAVYAISDEVHQVFVPGRSGEVGDVLLDTVAAGIGVIGYHGIKQYLTKRAARHA